MKICQIVVAVGYLTALALAEDCVEHCTCSDGLSSVARCTQLTPDMLFPERVKHLLVDSVPGLQINLTKGFFREVGLQQLSTIKISNCFISYIDVSAFEGLNDLTDIDLSYNSLILIHRDTFESNSRLERLDLRGNPLQLTQLLKAQEDYFLKSLSLLELDLSNCQLSNVDKRLLSQVQNLQYINLKSNDIKVIDDYIFENVPLLDEVDLSDNLLISLNDEIFEDIEELTTLNLRNNLIENIEELDLPGLKELDVSLNSIKLIKKNTFEGVPDLSTLNISHNKITWISEETFKDLIELRHLDLSHNSLIGPLPKFIFEENEYLETLSIGGNNGMHIFEGFSTELPRLYKLDISDCGLHNITNASFSSMPSLAILNASVNSLTSLNHVMMSKLHRLNTLDLSHNEITKVGAYTFSSNSNLRKLNLSHNKIHHLSPNTFETTPHLSHLDISYNQLSYVWHSNDSEYMKENQLLNQLERLNIAGNKIKDLHKHNFGHLTNLKAIDVRDNPLECTSEFPAFIEWLYKEHIQPFEHPGKSAVAEETLEKSNLQWDDLLMGVCKSQNVEQKIEIKTKPVKDEEDKEDKKEHDLNFYQYTVIEDVKLDEAKLDQETELAMESNSELEELAEEVTSYVWPTFKVVFCFLLLAIGNIFACVIYNINRNPYNTVGRRTAFSSPFKRTVVKLDTTPRYHKLYEECSVPNTPIVKGNLLGNIVSSQLNGSGLTKPKSDNVV